MTEHLLVGLASIIVLGVFAQWLAWRVRLPSILLLLIAGFIAGPILGWLHPDELMGDLLFPIVSISVAVILFEGGLTLHLDELPGVGQVIFRLISIGALVTWVIGAVSAHFIIGLDWSLSLLLGAILVVTGPTVIGPLLRQVRPKGDSGPVLKWEGILIDPIGAVLAVLVFEAILGGDLGEAPEAIVSGVLQTALIGVVLGTLAAAVMIVMLRRFWVPDHLQNGVALLLALGSFALSNELHPEAGLLTVTVAGVILANQKWVSVKHIVEFKENLRVLLIGSLFILLAARLELTDVLDLGWQGLLFLAILIVVARPLSVLISTWRSPLNRREQIFLSMMAPRGIVAASVASIFAFELAEAGHEGAEALVSITFLVIVGTVSFYGLTANWVASRLNLSEQNPQGVLFVGAHRLSRKLAGVLKNYGFRTVLLDTNDANIRRSRAEGLEAHHGSAISEELLADLDLSGIGRLLALTSNNEVNSLATLHFPEIFSRAEVYQLATTPAGSDDPAPAHLRGRFLFHPDLTYRKLMEFVDKGAEIKELTVENPAELTAFLDEQKGKMVPLFLIGAKKKLHIFTADAQSAPRTGRTLITLCLPDELAGDLPPLNDEALESIRAAIAQGSAVLSL